MRRASAASPGCAADARPGGGAAALGSGTALRPAHRPPPVPARFLFGTHNRCRGNKAPGLVPTEGAGGSPSQEGKQWTMLENMGVQWLQMESCILTVGHQQVTDFLHGERKKLMKPQV
ncbi:uncharacterized protein LOC143434848 [Arvicanthis niloticus]|uniref:uncharacterized protein LOC143309159 n=1 Tax=Arvicanthis niloticus TaxID=61156 RepID=UPI00402BC724